jgi:hypothetical protein
MADRYTGERLVDDMSSAERDRLFFEGPDAWGDAIGFGRASFGSWHLTDVVKVRSREFALDSDSGMSSGRRLAVVYEVFHGNVLDSVLHGVITWRPSA